MRRTPEQIMARMGFPSEANGPYVTELRESIARQVAERGLTDASPGTWGPGGHDHEKRAKAILGIEWAMKHGHSCRVESFDGPWGWEFDVKTMRRSIKIRPDLIVPWLGDCWRRFVMHVCIARDVVLRRGNPYA